MPERSCHAEPELGQFFRAADLSLPLLLLMDHGQIGAQIPGYLIESRDLSIAEPGRGIVQRVGRMDPAGHSGTEGVGEHDIAAMRKDLFDRLGISTGELIESLVVPVDSLVKIHVSAPELSRSLSDSSDDTQAAGSLRAAAPWITRLGKAITYCRTVADLTIGRRDVPIRLTQLPRSARSCRRADDAISSSRVRVLHQTDVRGEALIWLDMDRATPKHPAHPACVEVVVDRVQDAVTAPGELTEGLEQTVGC
jgi:hypothetical protein